jgi:hypothetical protein
MTSIVHLSATRPRTWRVGQAALITFQRHTRAGPEAAPGAGAVATPEARSAMVSIRYLYHEKVPSSQKIPAFLSLSQTSREDF